MVPYQHVTQIVIYLKELKNDTNIQIVDTGRPRGQRWRGPPMVVQFVSIQAEQKNNSDLMNQSGGDLWTAHLVPRVAVRIV